MNNRISILLISEMRLNYTLIFIRLYVIENLMLTL
jgi:hypothetical protein